MKICCVYVQAYLDYNVNTKEAKGSNKGKLRASIIPLGISYIASVLQQHGHKTYAVLFIQGIPLEKNLCYIERDTPLICLSITSTDCWNYIKSILGSIKQYCKNVKIIAGGPYVTLAPEDIIEDENIDAICIGEGEKAIAEYADSYQNNTLGNNKIDNLYIKENGKLIKCDKSVFIDNIDELPYPDRHMWDEWIFDLKEHKVLTERGCPNRCIYCANHKLAKASQGKYLRHRDPLEVVKEIKYIRKEYPQTRSIVLYSENAASNIEHFISLCRELKKYNDTLETKISYVVILNVTKKLIENKEVAVAIKEANITWVMFGFESASKEIRRKINRPEYDNKDILKFCNEMRRKKIHITVYAMLCYPYETKKTYFETVRWLRYFRADAIGWFFMGPPKNTELYQRLVINREEEDKKTFWFNLINQWYFITLKFRVYITYKPLMETFFLSTEQFGLFHGLFALWRKYNNNKRQKFFEKIYSYERIAKEHFDKKEFEQALKYYNKVKFKDESWIYNAMAIAEYNLKNYNNALREINKALKFEPENNDFLNLKKEILNKI
ncbi:MAG: radical SAM protein [Endomicrobiaceae bacterium]|nr:radical SAM protein [Endomicrobiaceae bacterium]